MQTEIPTLAKALAAAQAEFTSVAKSKTNPHFNSKYADLADVLGMAVPRLAKHGIAFSQPIRVIDGKRCITTRLTHSSGESTESDGLELPVSAKPQELGSALTYYRRYDACAFLGIVADDDDDGNVASQPAPKVGTLDLDEFAHLMEAIEGASSIDGLQVSFSNAYKAAKDANDQKAIALFTAAKNKKKAGLA